MERRGPDYEDEKIRAWRVRPDEGRPDSDPSVLDIDLKREEIYEAFEGWSEPIHGVRSLGDLPENARRYVSAIESHAGVPIVLVSVGPERSQTIERAWRPMRHRTGLPA